MENLDSAWVEEEEGCLPVPPLDDGDFSPYHPTTLGLFQFFDEIDENGNVRDNWGSTCHGEREKQPTSQCRGKEVKRLIQVLKPEEPSSQPQPEGHSKTCSHPMADDQRKSNQACRDSTPADGDDKGSFHQKAGDGNNEINHARKGDNPNSILNRSMAAVESKLESTKRKLQESYQKIEKAKKQRRIQVIDFQPLPKELACHKARHSRLPASKKSNSRLPASNKLKSRLLLRQH